MNNPSKVGFNLPCGSDDDDGRKVVTLIFILLNSAKTESPLYQT
jgi:hypothetical protein